ncbi:MAG: hypothetical protein DHS20C02_09300 [Micavibrio sp.]|nr:MAG: hypothetical protein DHS20C02_09300 [Micavibrio sp.]
MTDTLVQKKLWGLGTYKAKDWLKVAPEFEEKVRQRTGMAVDTKIRTTQTREIPRWAGLGSKKISQVVYKNETEVTEEDMKNGIGLVAVNTAGETVGTGGLDGRRSTARMTLRRPDSSGQRPAKAWGAASNHGHRHTDHKRSYTKTRRHSDTFSQANFRGYGNDNKPSAPVRSSSAHSLSARFSWTQNEATVETAPSLTTGVASVLPSIFMPRIQDHSSESVSATTTTAGVSHDHGASANQSFEQQEGSFMERLQAALPFAGGTDNVIEPEFNWAALFGAEEKVGTFNQGVMGTESVAPGFSPTDTGPSTRFMSAEEHRQGADGGEPQAESAWKMVHTSAPALELQAA